MAISAADTKKVSVWLYASGITIDNYKKEKATSIALRPVYPGGSNDYESLRVTCFRWHEANGELGVHWYFEVAASCCHRPGEPGGRLL